MAAVDGEYWLKRQERIGHWARVRVHVDPAEECEVRVLADACAWLAGVYGSCAATVVPVDLREAAESGARLALADAGVGGGVAVTRIEFAPADTSADDVRFATAWAVWRAIGHEPASAPYIDHEGVHFPAADG